MSEIDALKDLAGFVANSKLASDDIAVRRAVLDSLKRQINPQPIHRRVTDLLGTVMALSARTRRIVQPRVEVDIDVFAPGNNRAVILNIGEPVD